MERKVMKIVIHFYEFIFEYRKVRGHEWQVLNLLQRILRLISRVIFKNK